MSGVRAGRHRRAGALVVLVLLVTATGPAISGSWTGTLQDGSVLKVDPNTRRPLRYYDGGAAPLWDGTHRLENGSVVIVRDGTIVPTEGMLDTWAGEAGSEPRMRERYCEQLVRKVCGFHDECASSKPCALARQLLRIEGEEQRRAPPGSGAFPATPSTNECLDALGNAAFPACKASLPDRRATACNKLIDRVCGKDNRCAQTPACDAARQLLRLETEERLESADPDAQTPMGSECDKARNNPFFEVCD
jgi:hypothetical protein